MTTNMVETTANRYYISKCGTLVMERDVAAWEWVLRTRTGHFIDRNQYRNELAVKHDLHYIDLPFGV